MRLPTFLLFYRSRPGLYWPGLCLLLLAAPLHASWWNSDWTLRRQITLDPAAAGVNAEVGALPVLVRLSDGNFRFSAAQPDGSDIRFVAADDKTLLPYHIEKYDTLLNEAIVWVRVTDLKAGAKTTLWLYYGNSTGQPAKAEDAKATYDESFALVYHFNEHGQPANDFTMRGNNAQTVGLSSEGAMIGSGLRVDGRTTVTIPSSASMFWKEGDPLTWSAWVKFGSPQPDSVLFSRRDADKYFLIGADNGAPYAEVIYQGGRMRSDRGTVPAAGSWHHLAVTSSGETITLYLDGEVYSTLHAALPALNGPSVLGGDGVAGLMKTDGGGFTGEMDELQIVRADRSAGHIKLLAALEGAEGPGKVIILGEDEQRASWLAFLKTGYVGVIIGSLTLDGWIVIGLLAVMSAISWAVMVGKARYVNRVGRANEQFLASWSQVATDLSVLDVGDADQAKSMGGRAASLDGSVMRYSPLYRIYHIGVEEIRHRLSGGNRADTPKILTARSIQAIRATLDGGLVRETQRLNSSMVLLTIAISGGPFLGLLGTVVGVMITFAAVAAAGEVNVNAIAPGIAAALAATVAGLAVAIPALFGYNYLLTRIKGASNDMHVFIDEFVTKLAEFYSDEVVISTPADQSSPRQS